MIRRETFGVNNAEFEHIGLVVKSITNSKMYADEIIYFDPIQKVYVCFINFNGIAMELIEPEDEKSPVYLNLQKKQPLAHICFKVKDMKLALAEGRKQGIHAIAPPIPAVAFAGRKIAWLYNTDIGLIELVEK